MADAGAFSLPSIEAHRVGFIGPTAVSTFVQALQMGGILAYSTHFWAGADDARCVRGIVVFVTIIALAQTSIVAYKWWDLSVVHFGDWIASASITWPDIIQPVLTLLMAAPIQSYYIWRCWRIMNRNVYLLALLVGILLAYAATTLAIFGQLLQYDFDAPLQPTAPAANSVPVIPVYVASLILPALLDVILTGTLLTVLVRSRSVAYTKRFRRTMSRLIVTAWETAVPPAACAIVTVVLYCQPANSNFWDLALQGMTGKLYVISFLVTLNNRAEIAREARYAHTHFPTMTRQLEGVGWRESTVLDTTREMHISVLPPPTSTTAMQQDIETFAQYSRPAVSELNYHRGEGESADSQCK